MMKKLITLLIGVIGLSATQVARADDTQVTCLAKAMYFEARGGKPNEQINIGNAVLNRTQHGAFPKTVCKVIADKKHTIQFPWYYNGSSVRDNTTYKIIEQRAKDLYKSYTAGVRKDTTSGAVFFHARSISPNWNYRKLNVTDRLHKYYKT